MDLASLSNDLEVVAGVSLVLSTGLVAWKLITSFTSSDFLGTEVYAIEGGASASVQGTQPQPTSAQEVPDEDEESEEDDDDAEPRGGSCGAAQMNQLSAAPCLPGFSSHKSPLQFSLDRCTCTRCGRSVPAGNPFP
jgi:hypothetical protein